MKADMAAAFYLHATALVIGEKGLLIQGASGAGKSSLAAHLIAAAPARGRFARLVGDDRVGIIAVSGRLIASGHPAIRGRIEQRGRGIVDTAHLDRAVLAGVVAIVAGPPRLPEAGEATVELAGVSLPLLHLETGGMHADFASRVLDWLPL